MEVKINNNGIRNTQNYNEYQGNIENYDSIIIIVTVILCLAGSNIVYNNYNFR